VLLFGTIEDRDPKRLLFGLADGRARLGVRFVSSTSSSRLYALTRAAAAQVAMLEVCQSFFAYEPVLNALKRLSAVGSVGLQSYLVPQGHDDDPAPPAQPPLYLTERSEFDLSMFIADGEMKKMSAQDVRALKTVKPFYPDQFPSEILARHSTFDASQIKGLRACLTQEFTVVQGPPGEL
jgi:hypothetical protein